MGLFIPDGVDVKTPIPSACNYNKPRAWNNKVSAIVFGAAVLAQIVLSIIMLAKSKDWGDCVKHGAAAVANILTANFGEALTNNAGVFAGAIVATLGLGALWIFLLQKAATIITWGTLILEIIGGAGLGIWLIMEEHTGPAVAVFIVVATMVLVILFKKTAIGQAAEMLRNAAYCVQANPGLVLMSTVVQLGMLAYGALIIGGITGSYLYGDWSWNDDGFGGGGHCVFIPARWTSGARVFISLQLTWVMFTFMMIRAYMVGGTTAMWYWHDGENISNKSCKALSWALTTSFGTCAISGAIVSVMDRLNRAAQSKMANCTNCWNPLWWAFRVLMCYIKEMVNALTKFCLIISAVTGEDFAVSVGRTFYTLKGRFTSLFAVDGVAKLVLYSGATIFSVIVAFASWTTAAAAAGEDPFKYLKIYLNTHGSMGEILNVLVWILSAILMYYPLVGMITIIFFSSMIFEPVLGEPFAFGLFVGCLANYVMTFFANVILDVCSAMFVLVCIDQKNGKSSVGDASVAGSPAAVGAYYLKLAGSPSETGQATQMTSVAVSGGQAPPVASAPVSPPASGKFCGKCGAASTGAAFCGSCGAAAN